MISSSSSPMLKLSSKNYRTTAVIWHTTKPDGARCPRILTLPKLKISIVF
jgi:hypothetical protein